MPLNSIYHNQIHLLAQSNPFFCSDCMSVLRDMPADIPEPATLALVGLGIVWLGIRIGRERK